MAEGTGYSLQRTTTHSYDTAIARVREELAAEGFGVLTEIDVKATLKAKLGIDQDPYMILGACNPALAHRALGEEPELGVLLPCNVVVYEHGGRVVVSAVDAERMLMGLVGNPGLEPVAADVRDRLGRVVERAAAA